MRFFASSPSAIAMALAGVMAAGASPAIAQSAAQPTSEQGGDSGSAQADEAPAIVVTGSLIRGTPLDAALPVEVFDKAVLAKRGAPSALEFAKDLTISGPTSGESYYFGGPELTGSVRFNLRGIGADKTLVLLNGHRMNDNTSNMPAIAIERVEILKDGAAVTYGADAVGGVVNFITRKKFVGLEMSAKYKRIDKSGGDYSVGILGGVGSGAVNLLISGEYERRSRLKAIDRDFVRESFDPTKAGYNPAPWSTLTNLAGWTARGALPAIPSATAAGEFGPAVGFVTDFTPASCAAVGGRYDNAFTCAYNYIPYYDLVSPTNTYRGYAQLNAEVSPDMSVHVDASYGKVLVPEIFGSPSQPIIRGPAMASGLLDQFYVPITNPYAAAFATKYGVVGASGFTPLTYRALGHGGNGALSGNEFGVPDRVENEAWRISGGAEGRLGDWAGPLGNVHYDAALTYNRQTAFNTHPDIVGYRLQEALNGFGGPNCNAVDLDPNRFGTQNAAAAGKNGCLYWNPFSSSFAGQPVRGLANPNYVPGSENPAELVRWLFNPRATKVESSTLTADLVFSGKLDLALPGGKPGWAIGGQWRTLDTRTLVDDPIYNGTVQCEWPRGTTSLNGAGSTPLEALPVAPNDPRYRGCTPDAPGPFVLFSPLLPSAASRKQWSVFGEVDLPLLDTLNLNAAVRHEEFSGGLNATVYKISGKWDVLGPLSLRASYGTNYKSPPITVVPGQVVNAARNYAVAGGNWLGAQFVTDTNLRPETATTWNVGGILQGSGFVSGHRFRLIVDYFNIKTRDEIGQIATPEQIANLVFNGAGGTITTCDPNLQPLLGRVTFNSPCSVGQSAVGAFSSIRTLVGNGPGQTTDGIDVQASYTMPVGTGELTLDMSATRVLTLRTGPTSLDGVVISTGDNRLGTLNFATFALAAPKLRANGSLNYAIGAHNIRLGVNFVSAVKDERPGTQYGENGQDWVTADLVYRVEMRQGLFLTASVENIFDRNPPRAQEEFGYDPFVANPLGRTFSLGINTKF